MIFRPRPYFFLCLLLAISGCTFFTRTKPTPKVAVIGAGMAGLTAAYRLNKAGISVTVFEASLRTGGRMWSSKILDADHVSEMGASFINSDHDSILRLIAELNLELVNLAKRPNWTNEFVYSNGKKWTPDDFFQVANSALHSIAAHQASAEHLERVSHLDMAAYLDSIKAPVVMRDLIKSQYLGECGTDLNTLNARFLLEETTVDFAQKRVNFISDLGDEAYTVKGGVSRITENLSSTLLKNIHFGQRLVQVSQNDEGKYVLLFEHGDTYSTEIADYVVITAPLPIVRDSIRFNLEEFPQVVRERLNREVFGKNDKIFFFYKTPFWQKPGLKNTRIIIDGFELHDSTFSQPGPSSLTLMRGGSQAEIPIEASFSEKIVAGLETLFPGSTKEFIKSAVGLNWPSWADSLGSYVCDFGPDYWYKSQTLQAQPSSHRLFFAGELWGLSSQGYMDSAVESAELAAKSIIEQAHF